MNKKLALAVLIVLFLVGDAYGMTAGEWMKKYKKPASGQEVAILLAYFRGITEGIEFMDSSMAIGKKAPFNFAESYSPIFCFPMELVITLEQKITMLKEAIDVRPFVKHFTLALAIINTFEHTYPCKELDKSLDTSTEDDGY